MCTVAKTCLQACLSVVSVHNTNMYDNVGSMTLRILAFIGIPYSCLQHTRSASDSVLCLLTSYINDCWCTHRNACLLLLLTWIGLVKNICMPLPLQLQTIARLACLAQMLTLPMSSAAALCLLPYALLHMHSRAIGILQTAAHTYSSVQSKLMLQAVLAAVHAERNTKRTQQHQ